MMYYERCQGRKKYALIHLSAFLIILKPVWFLAFQKTKSWLQLSPDAEEQKAPRTLLGQNSFWILSENYFEMSILIEATYTIKKKNVREILSF